MQMILRDYERRTLQQSESAPEAAAQKTPSCWDKFVNWIIDLFNRIGNHFQNLSEKTKPKTIARRALFTFPYEEAQRRAGVAQTPELTKAALNEKLLKEYNESVTKSYNAEKLESASLQKLFINMNAQCVGTADSDFNTETKMNGLDLKHETNTRIMAAVDGELKQQSKTSLDANLSDALLSKAATSRYTDIKTQFCINMDILMKGDAFCLSTIDLGEGYVKDSIDPKMLEMIPAFAFVINGETIRKYNLKAALKLRDEVSN